jgi:hypothetical protein
MSNPPPGFQLDAPPSGFKLDSPRTRPGGKVKLDPYTGGSDIRDVGTTYTTTGKAVDGDTIKVNPYLSARLSGFDAFERGQPGYRPGTGQRLDLGALSTSALTPYIRPSQPAYGTGAFTYGRPVVTLGQGQNDPVPSLLRQGAGYAAPEYLSADPDRAAAYMESERLGRMNRQGGFGANHIRPDAYRRPLTERTAKLAPDEYLAFDDQIPQDTPKLKRLTAEQEKRNAAYIASNVGNPKFNLPEYQRWFREELGVTDVQPTSAEYVEAVRKGGKIDYGLDYSALDAQSQQDLKELIAFSGMRPEVAQAYRDLLNKGDTAGALAYGKQNGMDFDPADIQRYIDARKKGEQGTIPLPLIDPGDGRLGIGGKGASGAFQRGVVDPVSFLDEMGAVADTLAPSWLQRAAGGPEYRENVWNSDRSFGDIWGNNARQNRGIIGFDEKYHPIARTSGQIAGGFLLPYGGGIRGALNFGKVGAIEGGVNAFGAADGSVTDRLKAVPGGVAIGGTLGLALGKGEELLRPLIKQGVSKVTGGRMFPDMAPARVVSDVPAPRTIDRLNIPPSDGPLPLPALGDRVPSAAPEAGERARSWIDVADYPPEGFVLDAPLAGRMDMGADNSLPSLSSPRIRDMIDVNTNRPTRLLDGPTDAMVRAATARVEPGDILPRPANEVQSLDEFSRISEGLYPNVRAPNERDLLTPRQFPSRANPDNMLNRKGPLDLAAFVRSEGGVADFRGELRAAGLSNAPRKGDDFTGGENRLGPLLNDESGSTLDDMAQRAWEAGYFPDHATRPTVDEFVTALGDTYRGVNRTFRPDDFAEIDAFNAARDQRQAVERGRQEGAPLADDMGQPATYDDIVANTPPPMNPDDWNPATLAKVGNVRVDKLDSPQEISRALKVGHDVAGGFDSSRRGVITQAETEALASDLGMTADDLLTRRKGQALNAEEALAARRILAASGNELVNMARQIQRLENPGDDLLTQFRMAMTRHTAIQEQVAGATAEAGRALQQFRMAASSRDHQGRVLEAVVNAGGGKDNLKRVADKIIDLERDPGSFNQFVRQVDKPGWKDKALELYYNFLLSGPQTHAVNVFSNTLTTLGQLPEHATAALIGRGRQAFSKSDVDRITMDEVGARAAGMLQGAKEGLAEIANRFRKAPGDESGAWASAKRWGNAIADVEPSDFVTKIEGQSQHAISGVKGKALRLPSSALTIEDEFFKAVARRSELASQAVRKARLEGASGKDAKARAAELLANPTDDMWEAAKDFARYTTFQRPLGEHASKIAALTNGAPVLKAILPFIRTPTNLIKFAVERSPAAPLLREWRQDFAAGGARRDMAMARAMIGSGVGAVIAELATQGYITGSPPLDENKRRLLYANGWQPYSIKIGDEYYSYRRLDPFALTFGTAADIATVGEGMSDKQREYGAALVAASVISNLANKTWLSGLAGTVDAVKDPERYGGSWIDRLAGVVVPTGIAQIARTIDPTMRETDGTLEYIQSRVPGMSDGLLPKRDIWGRPMSSEGGVGPDIVSPIWTSTDKKDQITNEALRVGATISKPNKGDMTPEQYDRLQPVAGELARKWIGELMATPEYRAMTKEDQAEEIRSAVTAARKEAKAHVLGGEALDDVRPERKRRSARPSGLPDGFVLDPPPAGFVLDR